MSFVRGALSGFAPKSRKSVGGNDQQTSLREAMRNRGGVQRAAVHAPTDVEDNEEEPRVKSALDWLNLTAFPVQALQNAIDKLGAARGGTDEDEETTRVTVSAGGRMAGSRRHSRTSANASNVGTGDVQPSGNSSASSLRSALSARGGITRRPPPGLGADGRPLGTLAEATTPPPEAAEALEDLDVVAAGIGVAFEPVDEVAARAEAAAATEVGKAPEAAALREAVMADEAAEAANIARAAEAARAAKASKVEAVDGGGALAEAKEAEAPAVALAEAAAEEEPPVAAEASCEAGGEARGEAGEVLEEEEAVPVEAVAVEAPVAEARAAEAPAAEDAAAEDAVAEDAAAEDALAADSAAKTEATLPSQPPKAAGTGVAAASEGGEAPRKSRHSWAPRLVAASGATELAGRLEERRRGERERESTAAAMRADREADATPAPALVSSALREAKETSATPSAPVVATPSMWARQPVADEGSPEDAGDVDGDAPRRARRTSWIRPAEDDKAEADRPRGNFRDLGEFWGNKAMCFAGPSICEGKGRLSKNEAQAMLQRLISVGSTVDFDEVRRLRKLISEMDAATTAAG